MNKLRNIKITAKIVMIVLFLQFSTMGIFTYFNEKNQERRERNNMDDKLRTVAHAVNDFIYQEYHDRILDESSIENEEYMDLLVRLSAFADKANVQYISSLIKRDGKVLFTSTSATKSDFDTQNYELFFEEYPEATQEFRDAFENKKPFFEETRAKYGYLRTLFIPYMNQYGETYIVAIDIEVTHIEAIFEESRKQTVMLASFIFIISAFLSAILISFMLKRIGVIRNALQEFFDYLNRKTTVLSPINVESKDELGEMATLINNNIGVISSNISKDNELIENIANISEHMIGGSFAARIEVHGENPALNQVKDIMNDLFTNMQILILDILKVLEEFSKQNYNYKLKEYDLDGEMGKLVVEVNTFSKHLSDYMLNTAYDSINLEKDSSFLNEYIDGLKEKVHAHLKELNQLKDLLNELKRFSAKSVDNVQGVEKETAYLSESLNKLQDKTKEALGNDKVLEERVRLELGLQIDEILNDIAHSVKIITDNKDETQRYLDQSSSLTQKLTEEFDMYEEKIISGRKSIDETKKVSTNLKQLSQRMRDYIDKSEFAGKENINILINTTDR